MNRLHNAAAPLIAGILMTLLALSPGVSAQTLSDAQLIAWARDTYQRRDYIYSAIHLHALLQRRVPAVANSPALASEVKQALAYSIKRLEADRGDAIRWKQELNRREDAQTGGIGVTGQALTEPPPVVHWPRL